MTLRELLATVAPAKLEQIDHPRLEAALHDSEGSDTPLLVRLFTVIGTWIGAALFALMFVALNLYETVPLAVMMIVLLYAAAFVFARATVRSLALTQLIWIAVVSAQGLALAVFDNLGTGEDSIVLSLIGLQLLTVVLIRLPSLQLVSMVAAVGFATWFADLLTLPMYPVWVALPVVGLATAVWIFEVPLAARLGRTWSALAFGLPLGSTLPLALISRSFEVPSLEADGLGPLLATLAMLVLIGIVLLVAKQEQEGEIETRTLVVGIIAVLTAFAGQQVPGLSLALLWLLVAHLRKSVELQALAVAQLAGFLFLFYYQLDTTLLLKSLWVVSTGVVITFGAWLGPSINPDKPAHERSPRWLPAIVLALFTSGVVIGGSLHKQWILASGQTVLLPLAPVDPRSLMQGDYMALRYQLARDVGDPTGAPRHGNLVIAIDERGVGQFVRFDDGRPLNPGEQWLEYRLRDNLRIGAESFFFEEGSGAVYAQARYGELVIAEGGEAVLVGLRDEDLQPLGVRLHDR